MTDRTRKDRLLRHADYLGRQARGSLADDLRSVLGDVENLADALLIACLYLDGFIWLEDPEATEMDDIKATVAAALGCKTWEQAMDLAKLRESRRAGVSTDGEDR